MTDNMTTVDRLTKRRAHFSTVMGILFLVQGVRGADSHVSHVAQTAGWAIWGVLLALFLLFGTGLLKGARIRALLNDEATEANRRTALVDGFWMMLLGAGIAFGASLRRPLTAQSAILLIVSLGIGMTLIRFGALERRALRG